MPDRPNRVHGLDEIRLRVNLFGDRIVAFVSDGDDVEIKEVSFPVGVQPTLAEVLAKFQGDVIARYRLKESDEDEDVSRQIAALPSVGPIDVLRKVGLPPMGEVSDDA